MNIDIRLSLWMCILLVVGAIISQTLELLWGGAFLTCIYVFNLMNVGFIRFLKANFLLAPFVIMLFSTWVLLVGAPPGENQGTDVAGAVIYCMTITLRMWIIFSALYSFSAKVIDAGIHESLDILRLPYTLKILLMSSLAIFMDLNRLIFVSYESMLVRGFVKRKSIISKVRVVPSLLRIVIITGLRTALKRAELWDNRDLFRERVSISESSSKTYLLTPFISWVILGSYFRLFMW